MTDDDIDRQIASDPDVAPEFTEAMLERAMVIDPKRVPITIKIEPAVLAFFKQAGPGYQTRMNGVMRAYMEAQLAAAGRKKAGRR